MNITLKQLRAFVVVAKEESFVLACEHLHISQPALSIAIKNLESSIGGALFLRTTRAVMLTPEGRKFLPTAQRLIQDCDTAFEDLSQSFSLQQGMLSIAAMPSFASGLLPIYLQEFRCEFPKVNIRVHDVVAEDAVKMVEDGQAELALVFEVPNHPQLSFTPLFEDVFVAALPAGSAHESGNITWKKLMKSPFIALQKPSNIRVMIQESLKVHDIDLHIDYEANHLATIGQMVASGMGASAVPSLCIPLFKAQGANIFPLVNPRLMRRVGIVTHQHTPLSVAAKSFIKQLVKEYNS